MDVILAYTSMPEKVLLLKLNNQIVNGTNITWRIAGIVWTWSFLIITCLIEIYSFCLSFAPVFSS